MAEGEKMGSIKVTKSQMGRKMEAEVVEGGKKSRGMRQKEEIMAGTEVR